MVTRGSRDPRPTVARQLPPAAEIDRRIAPDRIPVALTLRLPPVRRFVQSADQRHRDAVLESPEP
jgi:hypothetical protein